MAVEVFFHLHNNFSHSIFVLSILSGYCKAECKHLKKILSNNICYPGRLHSHHQVKRDESGAIHVTKQKHLHLYYDLINFTVSVT